MLIAEEEARFWTGLQVTGHFWVGREGSISYQSPVEHLTVQFLSKPPDQYLWNSFGVS